MKNFIIIAMLSIIFSGCATKITTYQQHELKSYESKGFYVEEKSPGTGAALGLLPGGGSFYTRNYGLGVVNLLLWPISILWDPVSGHDGAESINYYTTKSNVTRLKNQDMKIIDRELEDGKLDKDSYIVKKRLIEDKYSSELL